MKTPASLKKITTTCGQEYDKSRLEILHFQPLSFTRSNTAYTYYRTSESEYLRCRHHYNFATDTITRSCEKITEKEALLFLYGGKRLTDLY
jgi:hypothetical protein